MNFNFQQNEDKDPLKEFGRNLTDEAVSNKIDPIIGRDEEIRRVIRILSRKTKNNPILIGEPGVGKTAIAEGLAQKIVEGNVPESLKDKEIIELDVPALIAGASFQGQFEKRIKDVMKKIKDSGGNIIVFIDEIHTLIGTGKMGQGGMDAAQIIKPMLARGEMRLIGATTLEEHKKYIESDPAFERRLQQVMINEPSEEESVTILRGIKERFENYHSVKISDEAVVQAVKLSKRYISDRFLPDKAIDLIDEAAAGIHTQMNSKPEALEKLEQKLAIAKMEKAALVKEKDEKSKIKVKELLPKIKDLENKIASLKKEWENEKLQASKISSLKEKIELAKTKQQRFQNDGEYEKASLLLYKEIPALKKQLESYQQVDKKATSILKDTVTVNEIADIVSKWTGVPVSKLLQEEQEKLLALKDNLTKVIKGQDQALELISDAILRSRANINNPNRPIGSFIFAGPTGVGKTEVAKALSKELFSSEKALIRIDMSEFQEIHSVARFIGSPPGYVGFEEGGQLAEQVRKKPYSIILFDEIEKAHPKVLDILLQIIDDGHIKDAKGKFINFKNTIIILTTNIGSTEILANKKVDLEKIMLKYLRPEFINRVDEIIKFNSLNQKVINEIVQLELKKLEKRLLEKDIRMSFSTQVISFIAKEAYDPAFGARPIKRWIQKNIESKVARDIIANKIKTNQLYETSLDKNNNIEYKEKVVN